MNGIADQIGAFVGALAGSCCGSLILAGVVIVAASFLGRRGPPAGMARPPFPGPPPGGPG